MYSLRPQQMVYTLPGRNYKEADLTRISEQAFKEADVALLEDAWEVSTSACLYTPTLKVLSCSASFQNMTKAQEEAAASKPPFMLLLLTCLRLCVFTNDRTACKSSMLPAMACKELADSARELDRSAVAELERLFAHSQKKFSNLLERRNITVQKNTKSSVERSQ